MENWKKFPLCRVWSKKISHKIVTLISNNKSCSIWRTWFWEMSCRKFLFARMSAEKRSTLTQSAMETTRKGRWLFTRMTLQGLSQPSQSQGNFEQETNFLLQKCLKERVRKLSNWSWTLKKCCRTTHLKKMFHISLLTIFSSTLCRKLGSKATLKTNFVTHFFLLCLRLVGFGWLLGRFLSMIKVSYMEFYCMHSVTFLRLSHWNNIQLNLLTTSLVFFKLAWNKPIRSSKPGKTANSRLISTLISVHSQSVASPHQSSSDSSVWLCPKVKCA